MDAEQDDFRAMLVGFAEKSDDILKEEMKEDEASIASPETLPEVRDRALLRSSERMVQMDGIEKEEAKRMSLVDVGKKVDAVNKVAKAGETIAKVSEWFLGWI